MTITIKLTIEGGPYPFHGQFTDRKAAQLAITQYLKMTAAYEKIPTGQEKMAAAHERLQPPVLDEALLAALRRSAGAAEPPGAERTDENINTTSEPATATGYVGPRIIGSAVPAAAAPQSQVASEPTEADFAENVAELCGPPNLSKLTEGARKAYNEQPMTCVREKGHKERHRWKVA